MGNKIPKLIGYKMLCLVLIVITWVLTISYSIGMFKAHIKERYEEVQINDDRNETTLLLAPQDKVRQSFLLTNNRLNNIKIAFSYEDIVKNTASLLIEFYYEDELIVSQALPLYACPPQTFLNLVVDLEECQGKEITVQVTNTSKNNSDIFALMSTTNTYAYGDYTEGYYFNNNLQDGSILASFRYMESYDYYTSLTYAFWILMFAVILTGLIVRGYSWLQWHMCH